MIVYVDVLIALNLFVNYFILLLTAKICKHGHSLFRCILASFIGALFSLYIFLPDQSFAVEAAAKLVFSAIIVVVCFGFDNLRSFLRRIAIFYAITFLYAGIMMALWMLLKPSTVAINNGIVYFDISPVVLIAATVVSYFVISLIRKLSQRHAEFGERCELVLTLGEKTVSASALVDTGNSLNDVLSDLPVVVIDKKVAEKLVGVFDADVVTAGAAGPEIQKRFRLIPYRAIGGGGLLPAFKCDSVKAMHGEKQYLIGNAIAAVSNETLGEDYNAIINPGILQ